MAGATLRLGAREEVKTPPAAGPAFDEDAHFAEVCGVEGVRYVQGKSLFNNAKKYVRPAGELSLAPLTAEQEQARRKQRMANKKFFGVAAAKKTADASVPQTILQAERENARARAAESQAA